MKGTELKEKLVRLQKTQKEIAQLLGVTQQAISAFFSASDVRTSTLERLSEALNVPVAYFYGDYSQSAIASGDHSAAAVNGNAVIGNDDKVRYLERLLEEKERTIQILMKK